MTLSFVVIARDAAGELGACLAAVGASGRPGDQVVLVDAGSRDGSDRIGREALADGLGDGIEVTGIELGAATPGRFGPAANVGLAAAAREWVVFVPAGDRLRPAGIRRAVGTALRGAADVVLANHRVRAAEGEGTLQAPDAAFWNGPRAALPPRTRALRMAPAASRRLCRREFLAANGIRFDEYGAPWDEAAFHWRACAAASEIAFVDAAASLVEPPPPDPEATAPGYGAIRAAIPAGDALQAGALLWLLARMVTDADHLRSDGILRYVAGIGAQLQAVPTDIWDALPPDADVPPAAVLLRAGELAAVVADLHAQVAAREGAARGARIEDAARSAEAARLAATGTAAAAAFAARHALAPE